ncbi:MAG: restriction endonuclease subunit S [Burkholderiales bacterium]
MRRPPLSIYLESAQAGIACGLRDDRGVVQLRLNNVETTGAVDFARHAKIPRSAVPPELLLRAGDVLFTNTNSVELVGKTAYFAGHAEDTTFSNHITRLRVRSDKLDPHYLAYWLQHLWRAGVFASMCDRWIGQAAVQRTKLEALEILVPSLDDQRRIAVRLKAQLAEINTAREAAHAQACDISLLRRRVLAEVFATVEDAPRKRLGDHAHTTSGSTPPRGVKAYWAPAEVPWVKTGEVAFAPIARTEEAVSQRALAECSLTLLPPGTVLVAMYGQGKTRGQSAILEVAATTNQACFAILPNDTWEPSFLFHWLMASYHDLRELSEGRGGNQANLNGALLNAMEVPAPSRTQQAAIARRAQAALRDVEDLAAANQAQRAELERLPQRLLAQAFGHQGD